MKVCFLKFLGLFGLLILFACKPEVKISVPQKPSRFEFATYKDEPVFEDADLYTKKSKNIEVVTYDNLKIYLIDWNENGDFYEIGKDYIGVKPSSEPTPVIHILKDTNSINYNGIIYTSITSNRSLSISKTKKETTHADLYIIDRYIPIALRDGLVLNPKFERDTTVIYFWATWCLPCIETLKTLGPIDAELKAKGIDFIPVAYNCSNTAQFLKENSLPYKDYQITPEMSKLYHIYNLSKQFTFLKNQEMAIGNLDIKAYYPK